jgi:hypothetical protein
MPWPHIIELERRMRLLVAGSQVPDVGAFKRLLLVAEEVAFMDRSQ